MGGFVLAPWQQRNMKIDSGALGPRLHQRPASDGRFLILAQILNGGSKNPPFVVSLNGLKAQSSAKYGTMRVHAACVCAVPTAAAD